MSTSGHENENHRLVANMKSPATAWLECFGSRDEQRVERAGHCDSRAGAVRRARTPEWGRRRRALNYDEGREALLQAAVRVVADKGLRGLTFRAVAEEAGVNNTLVVHHFGSGTKCWRPRSSGAWTAPSPEPTCRSMRVTQRRFGLRCSRTCCPNQNRRRSSTR